MANAIVKKLQVKKQRIEEELQDFQTYVSSIKEPSDIHVRTVSKRLKDMEINRIDLLDAVEELAVHDQPVEAGFASKFSQSFYEVHARAMEVIESKLPDRTNAISTAPTRLPEISLPKFTGAYQEWLSFREAFLVLVGGSTSLANLQKLHYLRGSLGGEALQLIAPIPLSDAGYNAAWTKLSQRYENNRFIIKRHVQELLHLPTIMRDNSNSIRSLIDKIELNLAALKQLNRPTESWGDLIIELAAEKLDSHLFREWEGKFSGQIPTLGDLLKFLETKSLELEAAYTSSGKDTTVHAKPRTLSINASETCTICDKDHIAMRCPILRQQTPVQRRETAQRKRLCLNCLKSWHNLSTCASGNCRICNARHNTLLHIGGDTPRPNQDPQPVHNADAAAPFINSVATPINCAVLSTCMTKVIDANGQPKPIRALLDSGSEVNLITSACAKSLGFPLKRAPQTLTIASGGTTNATSIITVEVQSWRTSFTCPLNLYVLPKITGHIPNQPISLQQLALPVMLPLADSDLGQPRSVEMLLGNGIFYDLLLDGRFTFDGLRLQNTVFGWVAGGRLLRPSADYRVLTVRRDLVRLEEQIATFWEMEIFDNAIPQTPEGLRCESYFERTTTRQPDGRVIVSLPFKSDPSELPNSSNRARQAFLALERRLAKSPATYERYREFMREYAPLGHMSQTNGNPDGGYYLPHHCVLKESSLTTKLRVVFNGSFPTSSGKSRNDLLMVGPTLQDMT